MSGGVNNGGVMTALLRRLATLFFVLVLMVTSASMAAARAGMSLHGLMVLCVGAETVTLPMGPDGQPQDHGHLCPDCTVGVMALPDIARASPAHFAAEPVLGCPVNWSEPTLQPPSAPARAPPMPLL